MEIFRKKFFRKVVPTEDDFPHRIKRIFYL